VPASLPHHTGLLLALPTGADAHRLESGAVRELLASLPVGETLVTDATVILAAARTPRTTVEEGLQELFPLLASSSLARRLRSTGRLSSLVLRRTTHAASWAAVDAGGDRAGDLDGKAVRSLCSELWMRSAELRELSRLERGAAPGPVAAVDLRADLHSAGVEVERALLALEELRAAAAGGGGGGGGAGEPLRAADWARIEGLRARDRRDRHIEGAGTLAALGLLAGAVAAVAAVLLGGPGGGGGS